MQWYPMQEFCLQKQEENSGKTAAGKKKELQAKRAADKDKKSGKTLD